jgi:hypothetical protein
VWSSGVDSNGAPIDQIFAAAAGTPEVCLNWDYEDLPVGARVDAIWLIDGEEVPQASTFDVPNEGDVDGTFFACVNNFTDGLAAGVYEFAWVYQDELVFADALLIDEGGTFTIDVVNDTGIELCAVQFNPTGTISYGLNELSAVIDPGETVTLTVAAGPLDARVIDCDGEIRIEDASGFEVTEDLVLTVD